jgi:hypothetical protein
VFSHTFSPLYGGHTLDQARASRDSPTNPVEQRSEVGVNKGLDHPHNHFTTFGAERQLSIITVQPVALVIGTLL